jgi:hypothetical protein
MFSLTAGGDVAQLGERVVRNDEAVGSIPIISTRNHSASDIKKPVHSGFFYVIMMWLRLEPVISGFSPASHEVKRRGVRVVESA